MRALILPLIALISLASVPVSAQPYDGGSGRYYDDGYGPPRYRQGPPRIYERPRYGYRYGYRRPQRFGRVCLTSRGTCFARPGPINSPCGCMIPGFGPKRGAIGY